MSMNGVYITGDASGFPRPEPTEVYQEAALSLRYKRITAITAAKLQRAMVLLQLEPRVLIQQGLASRSSLEMGLEPGEGQGKQFDSVASKRSNAPRVVSSPDAEASCCLQKNLNGVDDEHDENHQDDGWGDYEDYYDSDSDIDDDEDEDDEIEGRTKGPIYAFLVYGGVQLRPDEYVLLFRALGVSPQYIEQLQRSNIETDYNPDKASPHSPHANNGANATHPGHGMIGRKASPPHEPSSNGRDVLESYSSRGNIDQGDICKGPGWHECSCRHLSFRNICHLRGACRHFFSVNSSQKFRDKLQQTFPALNSVSAT